MTTLAVVDDHVLFRETLIQAIVNAPDMAADVVYEGDCLEPVLALDPAPDLVLLDLDLGGRHAQASDVEPLLARGSRVLIVSALGSPQTVSAMLNVGVSGMVSKRENTQTLLAAVGAVLAGDTWTSPEVAGVLANDRGPTSPHLSPQEQRVLVLYTSGLKLDAVAHQLGIKPGTARQYLERIRAKYTDVGRTAPTKTALYQEALRDGLLPPPT